MPASIIMNRRRLLADYQRLHNLWMFRYLSLWILLKVEDAVSGWAIMRFGSVVHRIEPESVAIHIGELNLVKIKSKDLKHQHSFPLMAFFLSLTFLVLEIIWIRLDLDFIIFLKFCVFFCRFFLIHLPSLEFHRFGSGCVLLHLKFLRI